jgi:hypothetical protein
MTRASLFVLAVLSLPFASGCAFIPVDVAPPAPDELNAQSAAGRRRSVIVEIPFDDRRDDPHRCGTQKNGYDMETADVRCSVPPGSWVADALATGLQRAGFHVLTTHAPSGMRTVRVHGEVTQFFVEPKLGFFTFTPEADIGVRLVVSTPSGLLAERRFYFKGIEESLIGTESNFQAASRTATREATENMVRAVVTLLDRYPDLGDGR